MGYGIGAGGIMGFAHETVVGTYVAPAFFWPFLTESVQYQQETDWRRPIRQSADVIGGVQGDSHVEGDLEMEAFEDAIAYFLYCSRCSPAKSGATNFTYVFTPTSAATAPRTFSLTIVRNGVTFGYVGCVVSSYKLSIDDGILKMTFSIVGQDEATQSLPTPTWPTVVPYGAGMYSVQIPTATQVFDTDTFEFTVDDQADPQYRMKNTGRGPQFISYQERNVSLTVERDFQDRTDYDAFKALTAQAVTILATKGVNNSIQIDLLAGIKDTYEVNLGSQGDLVRASVAYQGPIGAAGNACTVTVKNQANIT
jgi:hypothetical protein